jgi:hypothetical protein
MFPSVSDVCRNGVLIAAISALTACTSVPTSPPAVNSTSGPFFTVDPNEARTYRTLAREQEVRLARCSQEHTCDQAHFTRALIALFENQQLAMKHFQEVLSASPHSRLVAVSQDWVRLLDDPPALEDREGRWGKTAQGLIVELLRRDQAMKQELTVRERRLEELSAQIESLKQIDEEMKDKSQRIRPRTKATPN